MNIRLEFIDLCKVAYIEWDKEFDCRKYEPYLLDILKFSKQHLDERDELVQCFKDVLLGGIEAPPETILYCMRELRFPEILEELCRDKEQNIDPAYHADRLNYWSHIIDAYEQEPWEDADPEEKVRPEVCISAMRLPRQ